MDGRSSSSSSSSPFVRTRVYLLLRRPDLVFIFFFLIFFRLIGFGRPIFLVPWRSIKLLWIKSAVEEKVRHTSL